MSFEGLRNGSIKVDEVFRLDRIPDRHEKIPACDVKVGGGGSAANTAVWLSRQGLDVRMHGWVGDDLHGAFALRDLQASGVSTSGVKTASAATSTAVSLAPPDDKRIITSHRADAPSAPQDVAEIVAGAPWLHITSCDPEFLSRAPYLFTNHDELTRALTARDPIAFIANEHKADVAIISAGKVSRVAATPIEPVDRTGGGDALNAGVIAGLLSGADFEAAAQAGLQLAARPMARLGAAVISGDEPHADRRNDTFEASAENAASGRRSRGNGRSVHAKRREGTSGY